MTSISTAVGVRKVFVDTSGWYAIASADDRYQDIALLCYRELIEEGAHLVTSDYVLDEALTRLRYDFGHRVAVSFWEQIEQARLKNLLTLLRVDEEVWQTALDLFRRYDDQRFSFTDCTSFALTQARGLQEVFAFDEHFRIFGLIMNPS
ncbi:MAG: PIN domain-containing protein [Armatimonadetes bacterium]|nr:PIN domain-containing protein [Armatimonadota bacterium]